MLSMYEKVKVSNGNHMSMNRLYNAYENNDGKFGCKVTKLKLFKVSKLFDRWQLEVSYKSKKKGSIKRFEQEVEMTYDLLWNRTHALMYYLRK